MIGKKERLEEPLADRPGADHPGADAVEACVKVIEGEAAAVPGPGPDDFLRERGQVVVQDDDVVAVPAESPAQVEDQPGDEGEEGGHLVGDRFRGVKMPRVEAKEKTVFSMA